MSIENSLVFNKIEAKTIDEHRAELNRQFSIFRLEYISRLHEKEIPPLEESFFELDDDAKKVERKVDPDDLSILLERYSVILREFVIAHKEQQMTSAGKIEWTDEEYKSIGNIYADKIEQLYKEDKNTWINKTLLFLEEERKKATENKKKFETPDKEKKEVEEKRENHVGLIDFETEDSEKIKKMFQGTDLSVLDNEAYMSIHLPDFFAQNFETNDKNIFSDGSMAKLAIKIIEDYPETKGIMAKSWIIDTAIGRKLGFKVYKKQKYQDSPAFWGQFQDSKGQINQGKVKKFLETGVAEYEVATGIIDIKEFLSKYLPPERKGKITLKGYDADFKGEEDYTHDLDLFRGLSINWEGVTESDLEKTFSECSFLQAFNKSDLGRGFFEALVEFKKSGFPIEKEGKDSKLAMYKKNLDKYLKSLKYGKSSEVFID